MNILCCSVGRRGEMMKYFKKSLNEGSKLIATDLSKFAPALYLADKRYIVPRIDSPDYISVILDICKKERIQAITTFIDPEIAILAENRNEFEKIGVEVLVPYVETARLCFNKFDMFNFLVKNEIPTIKTWGDIKSFTEAYKNGEVDFPVFVKPRMGSGSVGARKIDSNKDLTLAMKEDSTLIIQEFMNCLDLDADVYVDTKSHKAVMAFSKKKIETRIGGASKTISFIDEKLFDFIKRIVSLMKFNGPIDMDFFFRDGNYYLSEINPRFGGAYLHAYGAGVDFIKLIENNVNGEENNEQFGFYQEGVVMMMYDSVVICKPDELIKE